MYLAIAMKSVSPSLRSARDYCSEPRPPVVLIMGTAETCYSRITKLAGLNQLCNDLPTCLERGLPVFITADWTYHVVEVPLA